MEDVPFVSRSKTRINSQNEEKLFLVNLKSRIDVKISPPTPQQPSERMSYITFTVREDDKDFPVSQMTEPEAAAIEECVNDLLPGQGAGIMTWLEVDMLPSLTFDIDDDEEEPPYGIVICYTPNPNPLNGSLLDSRIQHPFPEDVRKKLMGKTFMVHPRQLGLNPWGKKVEIVFESAPKEKKD